MKEHPTEMTLLHLEVLVMPNGEVLCMGKTLGWFSELGEFLSKPEEEKS